MYFAALSGHEGCLDYLEKAQVVRVPEDAEACNTGTTSCCVLSGGLDAG